MRWLSVILCLAAALPARAQSAADQPESASSAPADATESARTHFRLGVDFYRERNFRAALIEFKRAYAAAPHYKLLYNLGQASLELQEYAGAIEYFTAYLEQGAAELSEERKREVEESINYLESRMAQVTISSNREGAEIYLDDTLLGRVPLAAPVRVGAGRHRFKAMLSGLPAVESTLDIAAGDTTVVALDFVEAAAAPAEPDASTADYVFESDGGGNGAAIGMGIATGVLAAGAVTLTILAAVAGQDYREELRRVTTKDELDRMRDDAKQLALFTDITWGATIASAVVTTVLIVAGGDTSPSEEHAARGIELGVQPGGLAIDGRF